MLKLRSLTALASAVALAASALTPASAQHHMGGGGRFHFTQRHISGPSHPHYMGRLARLPGHDHHYHHYHHFHWRHGSYGWTYGVPVVAGVATYAATAPAGTCTCLVKEYLDDGAIRFTDTCTKETAIAVPSVPAPRG